MTDDRPMGWHFDTDQDCFVLPQADETSYLYFPLVNEAGMVSVVTPTLHGDAKTGQNTFLLPPVSVEDLHLSRAARNFWLVMPGQTPWSATGNAAPQIAQRFTGAASDEVTVEAGFLWHRVTRRSADRGLAASILNFVPAADDTVELMQVTVENTGERALTFTPLAAIPLYGRSADNLRDHRHVTSLLHRVRLHEHGVLLHPTLTFDERGHAPNHVTYAVLGAGGDGRPPVSFFPVLEEFIGEGGTLDWPQAVVTASPAAYQAGETVDGYEALGGLQFAEVTLEPGARCSYVLLLAILEQGADPATLLAAYGSEARCSDWLARTKAFWAPRVRAVRVATGDARFDEWFAWVALQPWLRRLCGNSFLPYHDYGRGGRGWRDLWQDLLALLIGEPERVRPLLLSNFAGVRVDGSNATIIGRQPGEFKADRNNIPRVWMDHGAWPLLTTQLYIDQTGDLSFLLAEQTYFKDAFVERAQAIDEAWSPAQGTALRSGFGGVYRGSVLEHLLIQHLTAFFNVGEHNIIKLEGADWNDGLDMARTRGESVAFTALYATNLQVLADLVQALARQGWSYLELLNEVVPLLDTLEDPVDYDSAVAKRQRLAEYFATVRHTISGGRVAVPPADLAADLKAKADWLSRHIRQQEWLEDSAGYGWFNGYYDENGRRVEGDHAHGVRMTLTGQVFTLLSGIADDRQARELARAARHHLYDEAVGGFRLNTDFAEVALSLGRCFGFAFGHKENGAMFSHMAVMYAYALYRRGMVDEGYRVLDGIYRHSQDFGLSRMYPGLPEYTSARGRGMYPYLTGSASWYILTVLNQGFGVRGSLGDLVLDPRLAAGQFDETGAAAITAPFAGLRLQVVYRNPGRLPYGAYSVGEVRLDGRPLTPDRSGPGVRLRREALLALEAETTHTIAVELVPSQPKA